MLFHVLLFSAFPTFPMFPIPCFWSARLALFSRFRVFAALLLNVPIQVPIIGADRQGAFRCMGVRGQEILEGPHRQTEKINQTQNAPTSPMSAPGALARRFWGDASTNKMPATQLRKHPSPNTMARHRTLRPQWRRRL
jgi:hypothetical protein